jgi:long-chain acyl-CoA synthetase
VPNIGSLASALGLPPDSSPETVIGHSKATRVIVDEISRALKSDGGFKPSEFVSKVGLIAEPFSDENGLLTQTMKIRRNKVLERYADLIKSLFD